MEKAMAAHSSTLAWKIPWTEEPGRLQSMGSLRVGHDWATSLWLFTFMHWRRKWQPTQMFLPGESHGQRSLVGYIPWGYKGLDLTEQLKDIHSKFIWFGNVLLLMESSHGQKSRYFGKLGRREQGDGAWWAAGGVGSSKPTHSPPQQREKGRISFCNYSLGLTSDLMHSGVQDISWWISDIKLP